MKWLGRILGKGQPQPEEADSLDITGLGAWLDQNSESPEFESSVSETCARIKDLSRDLEDDLRSLESAVPGGDAPPRLLNAGVAARDAVGKQLKVLVEKMAPPENLSFSQGREYHSSLVKHLGNTVVKLGRAQRYVSALFPEQSRKVKTDLNQLSRLLAGLGEAIEKRDEEVTRIRAAREVLSRVMDARGKASAIKNEIDDGERGLQELSASKDELKLEIERLESSSEGMRTKRLREELDRRRAESSQVQSEMRSLVLPLSKALARAVKLDESDRLSLAHRRTFELLSSAPEKAHEHDIAGALLELRSNLSFLGVKEKQMEKIQVHVEWLIESRALEGFRARYSQLSREISDLEQELSASCRHCMGLESSLYEAEERRQSIMLSLEKSRESLASLEDRRSRDVLELSGIIEKIAGRPLSIRDDLGGSP